MVTHRITGGPKKPDEGDLFEGLNDAAIAEWQFSSLVKELLDAEKHKPPARLPNGLATGTTHAMRLLEVAAESLLERFNAIDDPEDREAAFTDVGRLIEASLLIAFHDAPQAIEIVQHAAARRGRRPSTMPTEIKKIVFELMDHHGEFIIDDQQWNAQARLEEAVREKLNLSLSESRLRELITPHLSEWRTAKKADN